tara:strand:+ start:72 stop:1385 length:1314 start_codon:yes stop_codon:yes gene_type:complete
MNKNIFKKNYQNTLIVFCYFCISIGYTKYNETIKFYYIVYILLGLFFIGLLIKIFFFKKDTYLSLNKNFLFIFACLIIFSGISSLYQWSMSPIINYLAVILIFYLIFQFFQFSRIDHDQLFNILNFIIAISLIFILLNIFLTRPAPHELIVFENNSFSNYFFRARGIFSNPNLLARFISMNLIICINIFLYFYFIKKTISFKYKLLIIFNIMLSTPLIFATNSRTSLFALITTFLIVFPFLKLKLNKKILATFFILFLISMPGIKNSMLKFFPESQAATLKYKMKIADLLNEEDFNQMSINKGGSSFRVTFWKNSISNFNFFGYQDYSEETSICDPVKHIKDRCDVHNNYIHHINKFGLLPAIIFHLFFLTITIQSGKLFLKYKNPSFLFALVFGLFTLLFWIFETATLISSFYITISFFSIGISQQKNIFMSKNFY